MDLRQCLCHLTLLQRRQLRDRLVVLLHLRQERTGFIDPAGHRQKIAAIVGIDSAIGGILLNISLYPIPYILLLNGLWPEFGSWTSLYFYSVFIVAEVIFAIVGNVMLDSMMADVVEDSEMTTFRRSEGLFYAARSFAFKAISAGGIIGAGVIVSLVGLDDIRSVEQVTQEIRFNLAVFFLPLYCGLFVTGLYIVTRYKIDRTGHGENLVELAERHKREASPGLSA